VALVVRVYVLTLTAGQPVWWDEAEYLIEARSLALGTPDTGFYSGRPLGLSVAMAGLYAIGVGETGLRVFVGLVALAAVWLLYRVGRRLVGTHAGFVAALLFSVFYIPVFYGARLLTEMPQVALCLLAADLVTSRSRVRTVVAAPVLVAAILTRFPAGLMAPILLAWALASERARLLRSREALVALGIGSLSAAPYLAWAWLHHGDPLYAFKSWDRAMPSMTMSERVAGLGAYARWLWAVLGWGPGTLLVVGVLLCARRVIAFPRLWRAGDPALPAATLVLTWLLVPFFYFALVVRPVLDRFPVLALPAVFLAIGVAAEWGAERLARGRAFLSSAVVVVVATMAAVPLFLSADRTVRQKLTSYGPLRDAGQWIAAHSEPGDTIMSASVAQLTYYTVRPNVRFPRDVGEFVRVLGDAPPRYIVYTGYESQPAWLQPKLVELQLQVVARFPPVAVPDVLVLSSRPAR